jgi:hypothetical protein
MFIHGWVTILAGYVDPQKIDTAAIAEIFGKPRITLRITFLKE